MEKELGVLKPGARADFLWLDNDLNVQRVWRSGEFLA
jgi:N-acetylglucosamine-6-phosphate deacetylase